ncbi:MAG TPA: hypothetical protein VMT50_05130, partial [Steroidobacteraceae bacterium]|nr:hypothetical protein [Steroidobacteraceae bacterium]
VTPCAAMLNGGDARVWGVELETEAHPIQGLEFDASGSYLNFQYTSLSSYATAAGINSSMTTPFAPRWKYSAGVQYDIPLGRAGRITPRVDVSYQDSFYSSAQNYFQNKIFGYTLLNGRITWQSNDSLWQVAAQFTNITDKLYYTGVFDNRSSAQTVTGTPGPPNEWALTVRRSF